MSDDSALPEPDRVPGAPHPRETPRTFGHDAAASAFLDAWSAGRLHHAWLVSGPRGVGKATLVWALARFLLATPDPGGGGGLFGDEPDLPSTIDVDPDHPVLRRMQALAEPRLFLLRRTANDRGDRLSQDIRVDDVRRLQGFLRLSAADGGRRVVIVDPADDLNVNAANALLKLLEEPPAKVTFFLISHQPSALLPTIRSRCRDLRLGRLSEEDLGQALAQAGIPVTPALLALAGGSAGDAIRLSLEEGGEIYDRIVALFSTVPRLDRARALAFSDLAGNRASEGRIDTLFALTGLFLARLAQSGATGTTPPEAASGEAALLARLSPSPDAARGWADLHAALSARIRHGRAVNLDPAALLLDMVQKIAETAGRMA